MTIYYDLVEIKWLGARNYKGEQKKNNDGEYRLLNCNTISSVGYAYQENDESIGLAQNISNAGFANEELINIIFIPKISIVSKKLLKEGKSNPIVNATNGFAPKLERKYFVKYIFNGHAHNKKTYYIVQHKNIMEHQEKYGYKINAAELAVYAAEHTAWVFSNGSGFAYPDYICPISVDNLSEEDIKAIKAEAKAICDGSLLMR